MKFVSSGSGCPSKWSTDYCWRQWVHFFRLSLSNFLNSRSRRSTFEESQYQTLTCANFYGNSSWNQSDARLGCLVWSEIRTRSDKRLWPEASPSPPLTRSSSQFPDTIRELIIPCHGSWRVATSNRFWERPSQFRFCESCRVSFPPCH